MSEALYWGCFLVQIVAFVMIAGPFKDGRLARFRHVAWGVVLSAVTFLKMLTTAYQQRAERLPMLNTVTVIAGLATILVLIYITYCAIRNRSAQKA